MGAPCRISCRTVGRSSFFTAVRSALSAAIAGAAAASAVPSATTTRRHRMSLPFNANSLESKLEASGAFADAFDPAAEHRCHSEPQIGDRRPFWSDDKAVALDPPAGAANDGERQRVRVVRLTVAHAGAERDQRMVQHGTV